MSIKYALKYNVMTLVGWPIVGGQASDCDDASLFYFAQYWATLTNYLRGMVRMYDY